jgi:hypothetical protein
VLIKVYKEKVLLKDDQDNTIAGIDFPQTQTGICEISDIYSERKLADNVREKLMSLAVNQVRKNGWKVVPNSTQIQTWFNTHPGDRDLVASVVPESEGYQTAADHIEKPPMISERAKTEAKNTSRGIMRIFQNLSGLAMFCVFILFMYFGVYVNGGMQVVLNVINGLVSFDNLVLTGAMALFAVFTLIEIFWTLSRKKVTKDGVTEKVDVGRGLLAFILIIIFYYGLQYAVDRYGMNNNVLQQANLYFLQVPLMIYFAMGGAVLSLIRKLFGRK